MWVTRNALERLEITDLGALPFATELVEPKEIDKITGTDAVHQGVLIEAEPLKAKALSALGDSPLILVLDQGDRSTQCRSDHPLRGGFRGRRADRDATPQPA